MKKNDLQDVKKNNRKLVLNCLSDGYRSRSEIVRKSGLSKATVSLIINEFIAEGCLIEKQIIPTEHVGRPSVELELVPDFCYFAGFKLFRSSISVCLVNQCSDLIDYADFTTDSFSEPDALLDCLWDELMNIMRKNNIDIGKLMGIGVVAPAPLDHRNGIILTPPDFPLFQNYNVKEYLSRKINLPVFLDKDSVLLAITDAKLRKTEYKNSLFILAMPDGIGSTMIINDKITYSDYSGEIGHTSVDPNGPLCGCGNIGCLEKVLSPKYLEELFDFSFDYHELVDRCYDGDRKSIKIIDFIASKLAFAIVNSINLIDLNAVIIHGIFNYRSEMLFSKIDEYVRKHSLISKVHPIQILPSLISTKDKITSSTSSIMKAYFEQRL